MIKFLRNFIVICFLIFLHSCSTVKEGFSNQKKSSKDEFLVEKKSPLIMPPDYDELPAPNLNENDKDEDNEKLKKLIVKSENQITETKESIPSNTSLEESIIDKIKSD